MAAILRAVALGLLVVAVVVHVVGFVTNVWITAKLDTRGIDGVMSANGMGSQSPGQVGMSINMGLWKYCMKANLGALTGAGGDMDICQSVHSDDAPGWMKGVQALGILSALTAVVGIATIIYSFIGDSKGDRARLLPHITAAICFLAGLLLLIAVAVYGAEYHQMMQDQMSMMGTNDPTFNALSKNVKDNTSLGYSFALETVAGVLMLIVSLLLLVSARITGSPRNMAV